jgi:hypothetical protein
MMQPSDLDVVRLNSRTLSGPELVVAALLGIAFVVAVVWIIRRGR